MPASPNGTKVPHSLRLAIFLLRVALGLDFFYLGFSVLFNPQLERQLQERSFNGLYSWISGISTTATWLHPFSEWAFLIIGICLVIGFATRFVSILGIILTVLSYVPNVSVATLTPSQFINDEVIIIVCLLVLLFANAGTYIGIDKFLHFSVNHKQ